ncbi:uncharacterized protein [Palaemon carinicauda]|uniref:uncharacterized protein isoform X2 n=1 Tax=Palaemon carinicauda TaxID=392227 RepID=UPI0035B5B04A
MKFPTMFFGLKLQGPDIERSTSHENLPSLPSARFPKGRGMGFIQVVSQAAHPRHQPILPDTPSEPFILRGSESLPNLEKSTMKAPSLNKRESLSFEWSRNISKVKNVRSWKEVDPKQRKGELILTRAAEGKPFRFQPSRQGSVVSSGDVVTGSDAFGELVVELNSRDSSPMTKALQGLIPSLENYHSRSLISRRCSRYSPQNFPQVKKENASSRKTVLPRDAARKKSSYMRSTEFALQEIQRLQENPRTPMESRRPKRSGDLTSPLISRSPRNSISRNPFPVGMFESGAQRKANSSASEDAQNRRYLRTPGYQDSGRPPDMAMGTLLSFYPREKHMGMGVGPYENVDVTQPLVSPLEAWNSADANSDNSQWSDDEDPVSPAGKQSQVLPLKVSWTVMMDVGVQTEEFSEEELDWDLSDHVDRETQTFPANPTPFQLNRSDAFVQTDYRYIPLSDSRPHTSIAPVKKVDASTQTEHTTSSVSTQTEEPYLQPYEPPLQRFDMCGPVFDPFSEDDISVHHSDASSGPSTSGLGSALQRPAVLQPLPGALEEEPNVSILPLSPPLSPDYPMNRQIEQIPLGKMTAEERWSKLALQTIHEFMPINIRKQKGWAKAKQMPFFKSFRTRRRMIDVSIQTDNDILTDEAPKFAARPPPCRKTTLLEDTDFSEIDEYVLSTPASIEKDSPELVKYLCEPAKNDLERLRAIFRWVTENISYDWNYTDANQTVDEILETKAGVSKDYVAVMVELCHLAGIRVKKIYGFARPHDFRIGTIYDQDSDPEHIWTAVFLYGTWRLLDPTWSSGYTDAQGKYHKHLKEHLFLTDPDQLIFTHFPYHKLELDYNRWQLLDRPLTLDEFNALPKVMPEFWECRLRLDRPKISPVTFKIQTEITLSSNVLIRYKYKFFQADEGEDESINQWVFCTMKDNGAKGSFVIQPPEPSHYILKIYAGIEELLEDEGSALPHVVTFLLHCEKARRHPMAWPLHDVAWGPTPRLYECGLDPVNQLSAVITTWGGRKSIYFEKAFEILAMFQIFDSDGQLLEPKGILGRDETVEQLRLSIVPPGTGYYKLLIYGIPRPQVRGRWSLPLLASYLIECKMSLDQRGQEKAPEKKKNSKRKMKVNVRR